MTPTVLHVAQPTVAGVPVIVRALVRDQVSRGWHVVVASPAEGSLPAWSTAEGAQHLSWPATRSPGTATMQEVRRLRDVVERTHPDLVHLHSSKAGLAGRLALRGSVPTIFQPNGWSFLALSGAMHTAAIAWERYAARWTHACAYVSVGERMLGEQAGVKAAWAYTPNGVDTTQFRPGDRTAARMQLQLPERPTVLCMGRICRQKGQDWLLTAWPTVVQRMPEALLLLAGSEGDLRIKIPTDDSVRLVGEVGDASPWFAAADVVALPSRWEGAPLVLREAMACARSVVAADVPGVSDELPPGAGQIVAREDVHMLATELARRLADPLQAAREGRTGNAHAAAHWDVRVTSRRMAELYAQLNDAFKP